MNGCQPNICTYLSYRHPSQCVKSKPLILTSHVPPGPTVVFLPCPTYVRKWQLHLSSCLGHKACCHPHFFSLSYITHTVCQEILLAPLSQWTWNWAIFYYYHSYRPGLNYHWVSPRVLWWCSVCPPAWALFLATVCTQQGGLSDSLKIHQIVPHSSEYRLNFYDLPPIRTPMICLPY